MSEIIGRIQPVIILPLDMMSKKDIAILRRNMLCVVECKDPSAVRFCEPPPNGYSEQEKAAIKLCRYVMSQNSTVGWTKRDLAERLADFFIAGSPLEGATRVPTVPTTKK